MTTEDSTGQASNEVQPLNRRDVARSMILGKSHQAKSKTIEFFGAEIELRQPSLGEILDAQTEATPKNAIIQALVQRAFIPGTNEHVFEDGDVDTLLSLPFGKEFIKVNRALEELAEVNFLAQKPTSEDIQSS